MTTDVSAVRDVEITDVQTATVAGNFDWTLVRLYTDAGVTGTGEAYWGAGVVDVIERLKPTLVGRNPCNIDRLFTDMLNILSGEGSIGGTPVTAISGIEIALHDLVGKLYGIPAHQLLGGTYREEVRVYCDCHAGEHLRGDATADESTDPYTPEAFADAAEAVIEEDGFDALKFDLDASKRLEDDAYNRHLDDEAIAYKADVVRAVTERIGDRANVAFDCHWRYAGDSAIRLAEAIEPYDVWWLEDPVPPENHDVQGEVTRRTETTIATGENVYRKHGVRQLVEEQAVDIIQPDMPKVGGMRETRKIADMADTYYMPVCLHNVSSPIGTMASVHVAAASPTFLALEFHARDVEWWGDLVEETILEDGRIAVPNGPGLGVTLDHDAIEAHLKEGEEMFDDV
ncbi:mandelate racemase/muconate lactonizing enzyme family protein [Natronoglomus mannanivorans]|uniref:mandelate racemase/muconate lactonizing enzyme family protein n=1 Tax=Natronoglomus mannanivorans TaxID=2979990 RepID=UPI003CCD60E1